jgi:hypothetical protein
MAKKRVKPAPVERKKRNGELGNRVMVSFSDPDYATLAQEAKDAGLPVATYARLIVNRRHQAPAGSASR